MTSRRRSARPASRWIGLSVLALLGAPDLARAGPADLFHERTTISAAGERCGLFSANVAAALSAAVVQARGAALRAGVDENTLNLVEHDARTRGGRADCKAPLTQASAQRVRNAFAGFTKLTRLSYPGEVADWRADRTPAKDIRWRLVQEARFGDDRLTFGLAGQGTPGSLIAVARFADGAKPYAARLVLRDRQRSVGPYLDRVQSGSAAGLPLQKRMPPSSALTSFGAQARSRAGQDLLPKDETSGWAFRFPEAASVALSGLDPREAVAVEFIFPNDRVRRAYVEVGDFAAGRAFLKLATR